MNPHEPSLRHLSREGLGDYLRSGAPAVVKIDGIPTLYLVIEPTLRRIGLRTPAARQPVPDLSAYRHISAESIYWKDCHWSELRIDGEMIVDAYPILCCVADRMQLQSLDFSAAVTGALSSLRELLAGARGLSEEQETGLFAELLFLSYLLRRLPIDQAISGWLGPEAEEHDFVLVEGDVEVKSTTSEERHHWIGDLRQLEPTLGRRLWLLSVQLTGAGAGGVTLSELIDVIRPLLPPGATSAAFERKLTTIGWRNEASNLYVRRLRMRNRPECFEIDRDFPAITPGRLADAGLEHSRFVQVRYMINLAGLGSSDAPEILADFGLEKL
jgi:Putative  PD-(D/E)XK family member, (DUF4420)